MTINTLFGQRVMKARTVHASADSTTVGHWIALVAGVILLAAGPAVGKACILLDKPAVSILSALAIALASAPPIVLAICATLSWRTAWQRVALFGPALAIQFASYFVFMCNDPPTARDLTILWLGPLIVMAGALPAFLMRLGRRWTIVASGNDSQPQSASISSFLLVTALWAVAATCTQWINSDAWFVPDSELASSALEPVAKLVAAIMLALLPAAFIGLALVLLLRATLIANPTTALMFAIAVVITAPAIVIGTVILYMVFVFPFGDGPPSVYDLTSAASYVGSVFVTALGIGVVSFLFLRLLGYRLIHRGMMLESSQIIH